MRLQPPVLMSRRGAAVAASRAGPGPDRPAPSRSAITKCSCPPRSNSCLPRSESHSPTCAFSARSPSARAEASPKSRPGPASLAGCPWCPASGDRPVPRLRCELPAPRHPDRLRRGQPAHLRSHHRAPSRHRKQAHRRPVRAEPRCCYRQRLRALPSTFVCWPRLEHGLATLGGTHGTAPDSSGDHRNLPILLRRTGSANRRCARSLGREVTVPGR